MAAWAGWQEFQAEGGKFQIGTIGGKFHGTNRGYFGRSGTVGSGHGRACCAGSTG